MKTKNIYKASRLRLIWEILFTHCAVMIFHEEPTDGDTVTVGRMFAEFKQKAIEEDVVETDPGKIKPHFRVTVSTSVEIPHKEGFLDNGELNRNHLMYLAQARFEKTASHKLIYQAEYVIPYSGGDEVIPLDHRQKQEPVTLAEAEANKNKIKK